ncbi:hypothetical protein TK45_01365 [Bowmanella sp. JS7-9]|nr:hypothetical protein TK45_01365 [Bowmanella sp. JS7-9]
MKSNGIAIALIFILVLAAYPTGACGCIDDDTIPTFVKTLLYFFYLIPAPILLLALGAQVKHIGYYFLIFVLSWFSWLYHEFFIILLPTLPTIGMVWLMRKNALNKPT